MPRNFHQLQSLVQSLTLKSVPCPAPPSSGRIQNEWRTIEKFADGRPYIFPFQLMKDSQIRNISNFHLLSSLLLAYIFIKKQREKIIHANAHPPPPPLSWHGSDPRNFPWAAQRRSQLEINKIQNFGFGFWSGKGYGWERERGVIDLYDLYFFLLNFCINFIKSAEWVLGKERE